MRRHVLRRGCHRPQRDGRQRRSVARDGAALFVAIRGRNHDGHDHIGELYRRGVRGFMVEREVDASAWPGAGFVRVNKSLAGLQALAAHYRLSFSGTVVGITGSSGKTTVKEWIAQAAPEGVSLFRSPRSYNSQLGVPLSILMMTGNEDIASSRRAYRVRERWTGWRPLSGPT